MSSTSESTSEKIARLERENTALRNRLAESVQDAYVARLILIAVQAAPIVFYLKDADGRFLFSNPQHAKLLGRAQEEIVSKTERDLIDANIAAHIEEVTQRVLKGATTGTMDFEVDLAGTEHSFHETIFPLVDNGTVLGAAGVAIDVTARKDAEKVIEVQKTVIQDLSAPLIPLADGVVAVPLIGSVDEQRMNDIAEVLLHKITAQGISWVLLDLTGVKRLDSGSGIVTLARAVRLLGADVILTGIRPDVARLLIDDGIDIGGIPTYSTLQAGVAAALQRMPGLSKSKTMRH